MKFAKRIVACALIFIMLGCSCELNKAPDKPVDGTPIDSSSVSSNVSSQVSSSVSSSVLSSVSSEASSEPVSSQLPKVDYSSGTKMVAFTFDDGPSTKYTRKIVDKLNSYGGRGTFFVIGNLIGEVNGSNIKYAADNGCEIGIHAWSHEYNYSKCSEETYNREINKTAEVIRKYIPGYEITLMRPVGGAISSERIANNPYSVINWSVDSNDWKYKKQDQATAVDNIYNNIMEDIGDGDIILMHEIYDNSWAGFCKVVEELDRQGYQFVTVSELFGKEKLEPGKKYLKRQKNDSPAGNQAGNQNESLSESVQPSSNGNNENSSNNGSHNGNGNNENSI